ncbi:hypothetical protein [Yeosuana sp. AK3]
MTNAEKIKKIILEIGKAKVTFSDKEKDYLFNGKSPRTIHPKHYTNLHRDFNKYLYAQLKDNCNEELLQKYIVYTKEQIDNLNTAKNQHRVNFLLQNKHGELSDDAESTHEDIRVIVATINSVLSKIQLKLEKELEFVNYKTSIDYQNESENLDLDSSNIPFSDLGRATFKMSKKESLLFLYVLEQYNLIEFENDVQRRKFIENNFNFTEVRNNENKDKIFPMVGVSSEISNFKSYINIKSNNKLLKKLLDKLETTIYQYKFIR